MKNFLYGLLAVGTVVFGLCVLNLTVGDFPRQTTKVQPREAGWMCHKTAQKLNVNYFVDEAGAHPVYQDTQKCVEWIKTND